MRRRVREDDSRSDELLAEAGRRAAELGLAVAWTSGLRGPKAKAAADRGAYAWKEAAVLRDPASAEALYVQRCRTRNPCVVASRSGLVLLEVDGELELLDRFGIILPETVRVASRRGVHFYLRPPAGRAPLKVQVSAEGIAASSDGYLIGAGALHESGVVYRYVSEPDVPIAELDELTYERLSRLAGETRENVRRSLERGATLTEGLRRDTLFSIGLELAHRGLDEELVGDLLVVINGRRCSPPLTEVDVRHQAHGAIVRARKRPSTEHALQRRALEALSGLGVPAETPGREIEQSVEGRHPGRPRSKAPEALELVREMLAGGPRPSSEVKAEGERRGLSERTIQRAAKELGVLVETAGETSGKGGRIVYWHPPASWRDRVLARAEIGNDKIGSDNQNPLSSVGSSRGGVTPISSAPRVLARPLPKEVDSGSFGATDSGSPECSHEELWRARDGRYRCLVCEPPHWPGEVVETRSRGGRP